MKTKKEHVYTYKHIHLHAYMYIYSVGWCLQKQRRKNDKEFTEWAIVLASRKGSLKLILTGFEKL